MLIGKLLPPYVHQVAEALRRRHSEARHGLLPNTLIMYLRADPSPASHFLPSGYSATPPLHPQPAGSSPSLSARLLPPPHHHQPHPLALSLCQSCIWRPQGATDSLPVASRSWSRREGPPAAAWNTHPSCQHPPSALQDGPGEGLLGGSTRKLPTWQGG